MHFVCISAKTVRKLSQHRNIPIVFCVQISMYRYLTTIWLVTFFFSQTIICHVSKGKQVHSPVSP